MLLNRHTRRFRRGRQTSNSSLIVIITHLSGHPRNVDGRPLFTNETIVNRRLRRITVNNGFVLRGRRVLVTRTCGNIRLNTLFVRLLNREVNSDATCTTTCRNGLFGAFYFNNTPRQTGGIYGTVTRVLLARHLNNNSRGLRGGECYANVPIVINSDRQGALTIPVRARSSGLSQLNLANRHENLSVRTRRDQIRRLFYGGFVRLRHLIS